MEDNLQNQGVYQGAVLSGSDFVASFFQSDVSGNSSSKGATLDNHTAGDVWSSDLRLKTLQIYPLYENEKKRGKIIRKRLKKTIKPIGTKHQICTKQSSETKSETTVLTVESLYLKDLRIGFSVSNRFSGFLSGWTIPTSNSKLTRPLPYWYHFTFTIYIYILYPLLLMNQSSTSLSYFFWGGTKKSARSFLAAPPGSVSGPVETPAATSASVIFS